MEWVDCSLCDRCKCDVVSCPRVRCNYRRAPGREWIRGSGRWCERHEKSIGCFGENTTRSYVTSRGARHPLPASWGWPLQFVALRGVALRSRAPCDLRAFLVAADNVSWATEITGLQVLHLWSLAFMKAESCS